jgi:hypothetical protein
MRRKITKSEKFWRREKVLELSSDGLSNRDISAKLQIPHASVDKIVNELKAEALAEDENYHKVQVPFEYKKTLAGVEGLIKYATDIMTAKDEVTKEYKYDVRDRTQAGALKLQAYNAKTELQAGRVLSHTSRQLAEKYRGLTGQTDKVLRDDISQRA